MDAQTLKTYQNPSYGVLLPNPVMFAALGINDTQTRSLRDSGTLVEGTDFIRYSPHQNLAHDRKPIFWTLAGLYKLCSLVGSPSAQQFRTLLDQFVQAPGALVPATPQTLTPPVFAESGLHQETYYPDPISGMNNPALSAYAPVPISVSNPALTCTPAQSLARQEAATLVANALAPQVAARLDVASTRQQQLQTELLIQQQELDLRKFKEHTAVILAAQQQATQGAANVVKSLPVSDLQITQTQSDHDPLAFALVTVAIILATGLFSFLLFSALRPAPIYQPQPTYQRTY